MIELRNLRKEYNGTLALQDVSFTVPTGSVFGFIGPNGAGKTTTLKILGTLLSPSGGSASIMGVDVAESPDEIRRIVGWMPDQYGVYLDLKIWEYLDFFAASYRIPRRRRSEVIDTVLELIDLKNKRDSKVGELSRGMTQKLCLGRALIHEPKVLLLDEPASGLDPQARIELRELFKELQNMGKTILVSSHILPELSEYCNGVAIIQDGKIQFSGTLESLSSRLSDGQRRFRLRFLEGVDRAQEELRSRPEVRGSSAVENSELELLISGDDQVVAGLLEHLVSRQIHVVGFQELKMDLGDVFMKITQNPHA